MSVSLTGIDEDLGVKFDSRATLIKFLILVLETKDPYQEHFVPVLKNGGIIPTNSRAFQSMLKRKGIVAASIPNVMRANFMVSFQAAKQTSLNVRSSNMNTVWQNLPDREMLGLLIRNLRIRCQRDEYPGNRRFVRQVCLPILQALHQGDGETEGSLQLVQLAENAGGSRDMIEPTLDELYSDFITPLNTAEAARYLGYSRGYTRRVLKGIETSKGGATKIDDAWGVGMDDLDEWLLKHGKVAV